MHYDSNSTMASLSSPHSSLRFSSPITSHSATRSPLSCSPPSSVRPAAAYTSSGATRLRYPKSAASSPSLSLYEILGLPVGATAPEIKAAYRRLARACHPDVAGVDQDSSAGEFMRIHSAYATLSDQAKRADYDRQLFRRLPASFVGLSASHPGAMSGFSGYTRPHWETDQCW